MALEQELKVKLDEAFNRGATQAELDLIVADHQKKKISPKI